MDGMRLRATWTPWIVALLLFGVLLLRLRVVLLAALALCVVSTLALALASRRIDRIGVLVLANVAVWTVSGLVVGTLRPATLTDPAFWEGDGRIFISYVPLLFFTINLASFDDVRAAVKTVSLGALLSLGLFGIWLVTKLPILSTGRTAHFAGLVTSHTGAGTVHGVLAVFLIVAGLEARDRRRALLGAALLLPAFGSGSREALVAIVLALAWHAVAHLRPRQLPAVAAAAAIVALLLVLLTPALLERTTRIVSVETVEAAWATFEQGDWEWGDEWSYSGTEHNVLVRMLYWRYALERFAQSPLVGIGFGRFTDTRLHGWGVPGLLDLALEGGIVVTAPGGAHNSYLHLAAENGLLGVALMVALWMAAYRRLGVLVRGRPAGDDVRAAALAGRAVIVFALVGACFGHALAAPTTCLPALTLVGVLVSAASWQLARSPLPSSDAVAAKTHPTDDAADC